MIAIQVSLYPLGDQDIDTALKTFWDVLEKEGMDHRITPLSTIVWGEDEKSVYDTVFGAYREARKKGPAVMVQTLTTAGEARLSELLGYLGN